MKNPVASKTFLVQLKNGKKSDFGYLAGINDSALQVAHKRVEFLNALSEDPSYKTYSYKNIERLSIGKYGNVGKGFAIGALVGFGTGGLTGLIMSGDLFFGPAAVALFGVFGAIPGTIIGGLLGSHKRKFNIKRNKENFDAMKTSVEEMAISNNGEFIKDSVSNK